jgi:hypothetical protein
MPNKFSIGVNKVVIKPPKENRRTPKYILYNVRLYRPRTIVATFYDDKTEHTRYYLGTNNRGKIDLSFIAFRATELKSYEKGKIGRPRTKRRYRRKLREPQGVMCGI